MRVPLLDAIYVLAKGLYEAGVRSRQAQQAKNPI